MKGYWDGTYSIADRNQHDLRRRWFIGLIEKKDELVRKSEIGRIVIILWHYFIQSWLCFHGRKTKSNIKMALISLSRRIAYMWNHRSLLGMRLSVRPSNKSGRNLAACSLSSLFSLLSLSALMPLLLRHHSLPPLPLLFCSFINISSAIANEPINISPK